MKIKHKIKQSQTDKRIFKRCALASAVAQAVVCASAGAPIVAIAQSDTAIEELVVTAQRRSILSAQDQKRDSDIIGDSIIAEDIGKLPDRSVSEALARVPGVAVSKFDNNDDPEHFAGEGAGVNLRGLSEVRAELNGRDVFSASGGRGLSFDDIPAELLSAIEVRKSPTADQIEGGLGGVVNLKTRLPFESDEQVISAGVKLNYGDQIDEVNAEYSALYSNTWDTKYGSFGALLSFSTSDLSSRADNIYTRAFFARNDIVPGETVFLPRGVDWRRSDFERERDGQYLALQWAPNDDLEFYYTFFNSTHDARWDERAFFIDGGASPDIFSLVPTATNDLVFGANGALISGTLTTSLGNGVPFATSTRFSDTETQTTDHSIGFKWHVNDRLTLNADLQYVDSTLKEEDSTFGLVAYPQEVFISGLGGTPSVTVPGNELADINNYSFGQQFTQPEDNEADSTAINIDLEYAFEDSLVRSIKGGVRYTDKNADNRGTFAWSARYQPWQVGPGNTFATTGDIPSIQDSSFLVPFSFTDFQRGDTAVPINTFLNDPATLQAWFDNATAISSITPGGCCAPTAEQLDLNAPGNINVQNEETFAAYLMAGFGSENTRIPFDGNIGIRVVRTENVATGQLRFPTFTLQETDANGNIIETQPLLQDPIIFEADNSYTNVLPSFNIRFHLSDTLISRFALSQTIFRPAFEDLKAVISLSAAFDDTIPTADQGVDDLIISADATTNPFLEPLEADQIDWSLEWYYNENGGLLAASVFYKDITNRIVTSSNRLDLAGFTDVRAEGSVNGGDAEIFGIELSAIKYFDELPAPFDGLGIQANYTYIDSETDDTSDVAPVDTDGATNFESLSFPGLSEHTFNITLSYETDRFFSRLAYNWRSEFLTSVGPNGWNGSTNGIDWRLPIFNDDYGQLDFSMGYNIGDNYTINFEASNITEEETRGIIRQIASGDTTAFVFSQDIRYGLSFRANF